MSRQAIPAAEPSAALPEATWENAARVGIIRGANALRSATIDQLSTILRVKYWGDACAGLPAGLDLLVFNGRMMSGQYPKLFQASLGLFGAEDCDGWIGPETIAAAKARDAATVIEALTAIHYSYLARHRDLVSIRRRLDDPGQRRAMPRFAY
jgi:lysozyme family protein